MKLFSSQFAIPILLVLFAVSVGAQQPAKIRFEMSDAALARIREDFKIKLDQSLTKAKIAGATVAFVLADGRHAEFAAGVRDLETRVPLQPDDPMFAGSIGKTFVAATTLQLVSEGKLSLDEKISRWLGDRLWFAKLPNGSDITLRMLLNHSSGIPNHVDEKSFFKTTEKEADRDIKYEDLLTFILGKPAPFPAGKGYNYSDTNYILIGLVVEKVTGNTLYDEIGKRFIKPLGLTHTFPSNTRNAPIVVGYFENKPAFKSGRFFVNPQWEWAGGGFASTPGDLALWATKLYSGNVLNKEMFDQMLSSTTVGEGKDYGLGVEIYHTKWGTALGHDGEFPGYLSDMRYYRDYGFAIAVQINSDQTPEGNSFMSSAADDFAQLLIEEAGGNKLSPAQAAEFRQISEAWLALIDAGELADSWDGISTELKAKFAKQAWPDALGGLLKKAGRFDKRSFKSAVLSSPEQAVVDFESSFSKAKLATETIYLKRETDGKWHVSSYSIH